MLLHPNVCCHFTVDLLVDRAGILPFDERNWAAENELLNRFTRLHKDQDANVEIALYPSLDWQDCAGIVWT